MNKSYLHAIILFSTLSTSYVTTTHGAVVVYTSPAAWESALLALPDGHTHLQDFESYSPGSLSTGSNNFIADGSDELYINISGDPGSNAIDNSSTPDPFTDALSPNGSTYYLGHVEPTEPNVSLQFVDLERLVPGFGADWVSLGGLVMKVEGTVIDFGDYLPTGSGFLGVLADQPRALFEAEIFGSAVFGMDEVRIAGTIPIPAATWLFGSGLLGLIWIARRKNAL